MPRSAGDSDTLSNSHREDSSFFSWNGTPYDFDVTEEEWKIYSFILEDRQVAAPAFYNLSESFVKFIVEKVGMKKMRKILEPQDTRAAIEKITGKNMDEWKTDWLKSLASSFIKPRRTEPFNGRERETATLYLACPFP